MKMTVAQVQQVLARIIILLRFFFFLFLFFFFSSFSLLRFLMWPDPTKKYRVCKTAFYQWNLSPISDWQLNASASKCVTAMLLVSPSNLWFSPLTVEPGPKRLLCFKKFLNILELFNDSLEIWPRDKAKFLFSPLLPPRGSHQRSHENKFSWSIMAL